MDSYKPTHGFFDLRKLNVGKRDFRRLAEIQGALIRNDRINRKNGLKPSEQEKEVSALFQQVLFNYSENAMDMLLDCNNIEQLRLW